MAHRGRLNVLANILGKSPREIFREFEDVDPELYLRPRRREVPPGLPLATGRTRQGDEVHLSLCFNPSHLEFVNPVALGRVRAKQDRLGDTRPRREHGGPDPRRRRLRRRGRRPGDAQPDASCDGYRTGGTLHVIVNNQIGFTTDPAGRPLHPLRHRRGQDAADPDLPRQRRGPRGRGPGRAAWRWTSAREFRRDVVIDMYCYRRRGHNEGDEPAFTQPLMYEAIAQARASVREGYLRAPARARASVTAERPSRWPTSARAAPAGRAGRGARDQARGPATAQRRRVLGPVWRDYHGRPGAAAAAGADRRGPRARLRRAAGAAGRPCPDDFHAAPQDRAPARAAPRDGRAASSRSTGPPPRRWPSARLAVEGHPRAAQRPGQRARHLQPPPRGAARRRDRRRATRRCSTWRRTRRRSRSSTARCPRSACWASSTATA